MEDQNNIIEKLNDLYQNKLIQEFLSEIKKLRQAKIIIDHMKLCQGHTVASKYNQMTVLIDKMNNTLIKLHQPLKNSLPQWHTNNMDQNSQMSVRVINKSIIQLRYEGKVKTDIQNVCIMIYQTNLYKQWVPFCEQSINIKKISELQKIAYLKLKIPLLDYRGAYFHGMGIDRIEHNNTFIIYGQGITNNQQLLDLYGITMQEYKKTKKIVTLDLKLFICQISPLQNNVFCFKSYCEVDSHIQSIPSMLINFIMKHMGAFIFGKIFKQAHNLQGTPWQKQKIQNPQKFYQWLHVTIDCWQKGKKRPKEYSKKIKSKM